MKIATPISTRKPTAYFAQYNGIPGILSKPGDQVLFFDPETYNVIPMTEPNPPDLVVLREVAGWMEDFYTDLRVRVVTHQAA